jgi:methyl-accepting chemotaxis protein
MNIQNLKIGQKLMFSFAIVITLILMLATLAYTRINGLTEDITLTNSDRYPKTVLAHAIKDELNETARNMRNVMLITDAEVIKKEYANIDKSTRIIAESLDKLDKSVTSVKGRELMKGLMEVRERFITQRTNFLSLAKGGKKEEATALLIGELKTAQLAYFVALDEVIELQREVMEASGKTSAVEASQAEKLVLLISALAVMISIALGVFTTRSITRPLGAAVAIARRVADGDLTSSIVVTSKDETGQMLQALKDMNESLVSIVGNVRQGTDTIATASSQIATGNMDLSSRTEEQASSLQETAASMEELTSTVKQNADNARQANQLAESASNVAVKGGRVVSQVVDTMSAINSSSKKIVDIIGVIDGIAFQTNILALNAAVEAARAGEQGRGFAVVAAEVRNLAQRSAAAAKEIKTLIGDSVDKVEEGSKQVAQAGQTMDEIVGSVKRVTDIMAEITVASQEQTSGIEQINQAITQMDQVTQQNAALVEEAAAAAASLQEQASGLLQVVSVFKLDQSALQGHRSVEPQRMTAAQSAPRQPPRVKHAIAAPPRRSAAAPALAGAGGD